jgi:hypothetical protein
LWLGLIGLCIVGAALRCPDNSCRAQPPAVVQSKGQPAPPKEATQPKQGQAEQDAPDVLPPDPPKVVGPPNQGKNHHSNTKNVFVSVNPKPPTPPIFETKADGYGIKEEDATEDAIKDACHKVQEFLANKYGERFAPTEEELKSKQIVGTPEFETADKLTLTQDAAKKPVIKAIVPVKLTAEQVKEFREEARKIRVGGRMKSTGLVLAGLIALLLVGGGYLRLEEATKGYYTTLLRVGAVTVLGILILSLLTLTRL